MRVSLPLFLSLCFLWPAKAAPAPGDSLKLVQIVSRLDSLEGRIQRLTRTNDSLNKELYYYRAKDDFYVMAVDRQANHFEWFIGFIVAIAGFLSYSFVQKQLNNVRDEVASRLIVFEQEDEVTREALRSVQYEAYTAAGMLLNNSATELMKGTELKGPESDSLNDTIVAISSLNRSMFLAYKAFLLIDNPTKKVERLHTIKNALHNLDIAYDQIDKQLEEPDSYSVLETINEAQDAVFWNEGHDFGTLRQLLLVNDDITQSVTNLLGRQNALKKKIQAELTSA